MSTKVQTKENGYIVVSLPASGVKVSLRPPKGKDLKAIDIASRAEDASNVGLMMLIGSLLAVEPVLSLEEIEDMDAEDVAALGVALGNFRALRKSE